MMAPTSTSPPVASVSARHRSAVSVLAYLWRSKYALRPARKRSAPSTSCAMRTTVLPLQYEMASNTCSTSSACAIGTWMACDERSASRRSAAPMASTAYCCHTLKSGYSASVAKCSMKLAKPSLSQMSAHQRMVVRLPNHWCASSCVTTIATRCFCCALALASSMSRSTSRYVMRPQFSMAPMANSVQHSMSILGSGYACSKYSS
mmetsp:Transcript_31672/g.77551  ORF Transcript_31672/g.77551 Transcript_31672/m.77551 type:complete len:205 (-) Transcript_31672:384-998(-)